MATTPGDRVIYRRTNRIYKDAEFPGHYLVTQRRITLWSLGGILIEEYSRNRGWVPLLNIASRSTVEVN